MRLSDASARPAADSLPTLENLLSFDAKRLAATDIAVANLLCATGLPGAEEMKIPKYLRRLEGLTNYVRQKTDPKVSQFRENPTQFKLPDYCTESMFRIAKLTTLLKGDCGLRYNPSRKHSDELCPFGFPDSKDLLINGLLSDERRGTCNSIPVIIVAVGRRLGYPLYLSANRFHVFARWDDGNERFNIEASSPSGFNDFDDDYYRNIPYSMSKRDIESGYYLKNFTPADELALFLFSRAWVLESNLRFEESLPAWAKCCHLAPAEPQYAERASEVVLEALYFRKYGRVMQRGGLFRQTLTTEEFDARELLPPKLAAMAASIRGHWNEVRGQMGNALLAYKEAQKLDPDCPDYAAEFERYQRRCHAEIEASHQRVKSLVPPRSAAPVVGMPSLRNPGARRPRSQSASDSRQILHAMAIAHEARGMEHERAGKWAKAQAAFALAFSCAAPDEKPMCVAHLSRVIRQELLAPPSQHAEGEPDEDPQKLLPVPLQGLIQAKRGNVLETIGRWTEAIQAYGQACKLVPANLDYPKLLRAAQTRNVNCSTETPAKNPFANGYVLPASAALGELGMCWISTFSPLDTNTSPQKGD